MKEVKNQNPNLVMLVKYDLSYKEIHPLIERWLFNHPDESQETLSMYLKLNKVVLRNKTLSSIPKPSPIEAIRLVKEIIESNALNISNQKYHFKQYQNCFIGSELIDWLIKYKGLITEEAIFLGNHLISLNLMKHTKNEHDFKDDYLFYQFTLPNLELCLSPLETINLLQEIKQSNFFEIKDRSYNLTNYPQCFLGSDLVKWLKKKKNMTTIEAVSLGQELMRNDYIAHVTNDHDFKNEDLFYHFVIKYEHI